MWFWTSYDGLTKGIGIALVTLVAGIAAFTQSLLAASLGALTVLGAYAFSPRRYRCADRTITVRRLIGDIQEPVEDLREVRLAASGDLSGALRLWGSGGLFGYYGLYRTSALGKCTWYATRRDRMVVVITGTRTTLYSPDDPLPFIDAIRAMVPETAGCDSRAALPSPRPTSAVTRKVGIGIAVAVGLVIGALYYDPGPASYTLTADSLTIHDPCFYSVTVKKGDLDTTGARVIDLAIDKDWRPTARTNGFANLRYASGWFRAANGRKMRMYRAGGSQLVLLLPKGDGVPILYQPPDPSRFLDELRRAW